MILLYHRDGIAKMVYCYHEVIDGNPPTFCKISTDIVIDEKTYVKAQIRDLNADVVKGCEYVNKGLEKRYKAVNRITLLEQQLEQIKAFDRLRLES